MTIVENNVVTTIKNLLTKYVEKDISNKYLESLFIQIGKDMGIDISKNFQVESNHILYEANQEIVLEAQSGLSVRVGSNVLTVDNSGIYFKTANYTENSSDAGVEAKEAEILKSLFNLAFED